MAGSLRTLARGAVWAAVLALLLGAWLALPRGSDPDSEGPGLRIVVIDCSASVTRRRPDWVPWVRERLGEQVRLALASEENISVIEVAGDVGRTFGPGRPGDLQDLLAGEGGQGPLAIGSMAGGDGASHLGAALVLCRSMLLRSGSGSVVLLSDLAATGPESRPALLDMARLGVLVECIHPPPADLPDVGIAAVRVPDRAEPGAPLTALVVLEWEPGSGGGGRAFLESTVVSLAGERGRSTPVLLPARAARIEVPLALGEAVYGRNAVEVRVRLGSAGDVVPENDRGSGVVRVEGELMVGIVAQPGDGSLARELFGVEASIPGMQLREIPLAQLPSWSDSLDAVITFDLGPGRLPADWMEAFVRRGGGWMSATGWGGLEGDLESGLRGLLPLLPAPGGAGERDVILMVDGSGSMAGEPFDRVKTASLTLVAGAREEDEVVLRIFTGRLRAPQVLKPRGATTGVVERSAALRRLLGARIPGGGTEIMSSLEQLAGEREAMGRESLVLLLTDGQERGVVLDVVARSAALRARLAAAGARLVVIAVGEDADLAYLQQLVRPGETPRSAVDLSGLAPLFQRELHGGRTVEGDGLAVLPSYRPGSASAEIFRAEPAGGPLPPVSRYIRSEARPGADVFWSSEDGSPLGALQRVGRGRTVSIAFVPRPSWAPGWNPFVPRVTSLVRWLARGGEAVRAMQPRASIEGRGGQRLVLRLPGTGWPAVVSASMRRSGSTREKLASVLLGPPPDSPGENPLLVRSAPVVGNWLDTAAGEGLLLSGLDPEGTPWTAYVALRISPEFRLPAVATLRLSVGGDGRGGLTPGSGRGGGLPHPLAAHFLGVGLALGFLGLGGLRVLARGAPGVA